MNNEQKLTFAELAVLTLQQLGRPATANELWAFVMERKLYERLGSYNPQTQTFIGKTPRATFERSLYVYKDLFETVPDSSPRQFRLKQTAKPSAPSATFRQPETVAPEASRVLSEKIPRYHERDLHPVLAYYLNHSDYFQAYAKTVFHEGSTKGEKGADRWLYPDMVAVNFEYAGYRENHVLGFINKFDLPPIKVFSFELKKELHYGNYKEAFFQAVSNSSWANEGYLVSVKIKQDNQFTEALQKLSQSFGIGIIQLNLEDIKNSTIVSPARYKEKIDYAVVRELAEKNPHFRNFLKTVADFDPQYPERFTREFDEILSATNLAEHIHGKNMP